jgi:1-phosphatidylinositol-4-phosphate 5-kinase
MKILPHYYKYVTENPFTTITKIFGMHRVKMSHLKRNVNFVIMNNCFDSTEEIHTCYDLKGSMIGREITEKERNKSTGTVLKDIDLIKSGDKFHLGPKKVAFMKQLTSDAQFLSKLNIIDYSLLVGM